MPTIATNIAELLEQINALPSDWHACGTMGAGPLEAIARITGGRIRRSIETGAGKTTLLLSHLSEHHTVFAVDVGNSVTVTRDSGLLDRSRVHLIEGPSQRTLLAHEFVEPLDFVLLDGPHGYPFPELEYWAVYRHIAPGGVLVIDDIHIPTIRRLYEFLCEEPMFSLVEVAHCTAFFRRTNEPTFDPYCDGWYLQPYNTVRFQRERPVSPAPARRPEERVYRDRLLPLIETWAADRARVAIFGTGSHTEVLFRFVPELDRLDLVAFLDSNPARQQESYRGRPVRAPQWAEGHCDIVLCSSFAHEMTQLALLDRVKVKAVPSHLQSTSETADD
jgi:Methyltransferase domain